MSLAPVPVNNGYPTGGFTLPDMVSFCLNDADGAGGSVLINGLGVGQGDVPHAYDLKQLFIDGSIPFISYPLLRAFRAASSLAAFWAQIINNLEISYYALGGTTADSFPLRFLPVFNIGGGPSDAGYLEIVAPGGGEGYTGDTWRVELKLRHSTTN